VKLVVSLDNLARQLTGDDGDADRVAWFTDRVVGAAGPAALTPDGLYWYLEPNDNQERPDYRAAISLPLDRVLAHANPDAALIRWITPPPLSELGLPAEAASERAWSDLDAAARRAPLVTTAPVDGVTLLGFRRRLAVQQLGSPGTVPARGSQQCRRLAGAGRGT
jgi:hypothetical protein